MAGEGVCPSSLSRAPECGVHRSVAKTLDRRSGRIRRRVWPGRAEGRPFCNSCGKRFHAIVVKEWLEHSGGGCIVAEQIKTDDVPGIAVVLSKLQQIGGGIEVVAAGHNFDSGDYILRLKSGEREADVQLSRDLLDDLRDNPSGPTTKYSQLLNDRLTVALLEAIEQGGLLSYNESNLKFVLLKYIHEESKKFPPGPQVQCDRSLGIRKFRTMVGQES